MNAARYYVALMLLVFAPGSMLLWFLIHPFVRFWRRVGVRTLMVFCTVFATGLGLLIFAIRRRLLTVDYRTNPWLVALAILLFAVGAVLGKIVSRQLKPRVLVGLPEVAPQKYASRLLTEGAYAYVRHPRYVQILISIAALALFANYLATYLFLAGTLLWMLAVAPLEEEELRHRFGAAYEEYCARVPRFIPRLRRKAPAGAKKAADN